MTPWHRKRKSRGPSPRRRLLRLRRSVGALARRQGTNVVKPHFEQPPAAKPSSPMRRQNLPSSTERAKKALSAGFS
ncbi:hypothetical protein KFL_006140060 [Klebsormidium nitens]|uniref:Uncharacterized protein n=1 Tax=Klebsormidium nitens TaxID=105231 RepID=A0A1Y1IN77_KLENI|nr:hypothetical protein KFL_006140060 [Klebsormidium nitens]|eukprot:GAQ90216.1 hypothetical protein KFL_006140060 [Klebsormidium nitens]